VLLSVANLFHRQSKFFRRSISKIFSNYTEMITLVLSLIVLHYRGMDLKLELKFVSRKFVNRDNFSSDKILELFLIKYQLVDILDYCFPLKVRRCARNFVKYYCPQQIPLTASLVVSKIQR